VIVDALGNLLALSLTGGQVNDITQADALLALVALEPGMTLTSSRPARSADSSRRKQQNKTKTYSVAASLRKPRRRSYLKCLADSAAMNRYGGGYGNRGRG
jgi:hypothetical protein